MMNIMNKKQVYLILSKEIIYLIAKRNNLVIFSGEYTYSEFDMNKARDFLSSLKKFYVFISRDAVYEEEIEFRNEEEKTKAISNFYDKNPLFNKEEDVLFQYELRKGNISSLKLFWVEKNIISFIKNIFIKEGIIPDGVYIFPFINKECLNVETCLSVFYGSDFIEYNVFEKGSIVYTENNIIGEAPKSIEEFVESGIKDILTELKKKKIFPVKIVCNYSKDFKLAGYDSGFYTDNLNDKIKLFKDYIDYMDKLLFIFDVSDNIEFSPEEIKPLRKYSNDSIYLSLFFAVISLVFLLFSSSYKKDTYEYVVKTLEKFSPNVVKKEKMPYNAMRYIAGKLRNKKNDKRITLILENVFCSIPRDSVWSVREMAFENSKFKILMDFKDEKNAKKYETLLKKVFWKWKADIVRKNKEVELKMNINDIILL